MIASRTLKAADPSFHAVTACRCLALTAVAAALLAACGGSSGGAAPSASPSVSPQPSPQITSGKPPAGATAVAKRWWDLIGQDRFDEARALVASGSPLDQLASPTDAIAAAHFVGAQGSVLSKTPKQDETVAFPVRVYIDPKYPVGNWDEAGVYVQYMGFVRMSDGSWRVYETGTGP